MRWCSFEFAGRVWACSHHLLWNTPTAAHVLVPDVGDGGCSNSITPHTQRSVCAAAAQTADCGHTPDLYSHMRPKMSSDITSSKRALRLTGSGIKKGYVLNV